MARVYQAVFHGSGEHLGRALRRSFTAACAVDDDGSPVVETVLDDPAGGTAGLTVVLRDGPSCGRYTAQAYVGSGPTRVAALWGPGTPAGTAWAAVTVDGPAPEGPGPQRAADVVSGLLGAERAFDGAIPLEAGPVEVGVDRVDELLGWLLDPRRRVPVVVLSVDEREPSLPGRLATRLAHTTAGAAIIARLCDKPTQERMNRALGPGFAVYGGALRTYLADLSPTTEDYPQRHPVRSGSALRDLGPRALDVVVTGVMGDGVRRPLPTDIRQGLRLVPQILDQGLDWSQATAPDGPRRTIPTPCTLRRPTPNAPPPPPRPPTPAPDRPPNACPDSSRDGESTTNRPQSVAVPGHTDAPPAGAGSPAPSSATGTTTDETCTSNTSHRGRPGNATAPGSVPHSGPSAHAPTRPAPTHAGGAPGVEAADSGSWEADSTANRPRSVAVPGRTDSVPARAGLPAPSGTTRAATGDAPHTTPTADHPRNAAVPGGGSSARAPDAGTSTHRQQSVAAGAPTRDLTSAALAASGAEGEECVEGSLRATSSSDCPGPVAVSTRTTDLTSAAPVSSSVVFGSDSSRTGVVASDAATDGHGTSVGRACPVGQPDSQGGTDLPRVVGSLVGEGELVEALAGPVARQVVALLAGTDVQAGLQALGRVPEAVASLAGLVPELRAIVGRLGPERRGAEEESDSELLAAELARLRDDYDLLVLQYEELAEEARRAEERVRRLDGLLAEVCAGAAVPSYDAVWIPECLADVLLRARGELPHVCLPDALDAGAALLDKAEPGHTRVWAAAAWDALRALNAYAAARSSNGFRGGFRDWCRNPPHGAYALSPKKFAMKESDAVAGRAKFRKARTFPVPAEVCADEAVFMEAHIKLRGIGNPAPRMHFHDDAAGATGRIHVGYLGHHLDNTRTN
ncbi:hypothetical protein [Yinghuangia seranimata]|uniref:hypothetical protein n=1 Tax=Yinghuangia seranimata TaxID=408067 RepID=UPI00248CFD5E|nr:hypothetical protein [Yinghuangia seranimata]MDI2126176.1 hypothetical protein [Yinghuangia seranimata]